MSPQTWRASKRWPKEPAEGEPAEVRRLDGSVLGACCIAACKAHGYPVHHAEPACKWIFVLITLLLLRMQLPCGNGDWLCSIPALSDLCNARGQLLAHPIGAVTGNLCVGQLARETTVRSASYTLPDGRVIRVGSERFMARL